MPIFEYQCNKCGHKTEFLERRSGKHKHICEQCGSSDMHKLFSGFSVGQSSQGGDSCSTGTCPTGTCGL
jgi:putative FmdB family regulatory protein